MKKILFPIAALLSLAACSKVSPVDMPDTQREISFQVANYVQTKAAQPNGKYDTSERFGTYAWFEDGSGTAQDFMVNETVGYVAGDPGVWKTVVTPYYWPKTGSIDFISYSPFAGENGKRPGATAANTTATTTTNATAGSNDAEASVPEPVITRVKAKDYTFEYGDYVVKADSRDLMYADWANASANVDEIKDDAQRDSKFKGVPTLFHHALAKINVAIRTTFVEYTDPATKLTTKWKIVLQAAELTNVKNTGSLKLTMDGSQKWVKPAGEVWTPAAQAQNETIVLYALPEAQEGSGNETGTTAGNGQEAEVPGMELDTEYTELLADRFVLPQLLGAADDKEAMQLHVRLYIETTYPDQTVLTEYYDKYLPMSSLIKTTDKAWKMNQFFQYKISFKPTSSSNPVVPDHPDDPTDVVITFDPAVVDWEGVNVVAEYVL